MSRTWPAQCLARGEDATPVGIDIAVGATALVVVMFVASAIPRAQPEWRDVVVALAIGVFAATTVDAAAVAALVPGTWMVMDGFLVNRLGDLTWTGSPDTFRLLSLVAAGVVGLALGRLHRGVREAQQRWQWDVQLQALRVQVIGHQVIGDQAIGDSRQAEPTRETTHHA